jgi:raffinose/stachyose/melibiose transport system permease protein
MSRGLRLHLSMWWQYAIAIVFAFIFGYPLVWLIYSSFKPIAQIIRDMWGFPQEISFGGYQYVLGNPQFFRYYLNNIVLTAISVPLMTIIAAMAAFVFARIRFRYRTLLFYLFLGGTMIPIHVTLIPLYTMMRDLGLLNTLIAIMLPYIGFALPVSIYILRGFFEQIPIELEEAARMDGCSTARIFWSIMLPLARPALVTVAILGVVNIWNEYLFALVFVSANNNAYTLPLGIVSFVNSLGRVSYDRMLSGMTLTVLPVLVFYFLAQRQIIKSLTAGAIKG